VHGVHNQLRVVVMCVCGGGGELCRTTFNRWVRVDKSLAPRPTLTGRHVCQVVERQALGQQPTELATFAQLLPPSGPGDHEVGVHAREATGHARGPAAHCPLGGEAQAQVLVIPQVQGDHASQLVPAAEGDCVRDLRVVDGKGKRMIPGEPTLIPSFILYLGTPCALVKLME
jgi:hypothetical protein